MQGDFSAVMQGVQNGLIAPVYLAATNGDVRYYWLYLAAVPFILLAMRFRGGIAGQSIRRAWNSDTWTSKSAQVDIWLFLLNTILQFSILSGAFVSAVAVTAWVAGALGGAGLPQLLDGHGIAAAVALTVAAFVAADFGKFLAHYLSHRVPALWELHKVHHAAEVLNPFTAERFHPLEQIFDAALIGIILGGVNGVFLALAGPSLHPLTIAGANVFWVLANLAGGPLRHMPVWLSFGQKIEHWILSPAQHQIHHSEEARHFDKNLGSTLALWDQLFGTLYVTRGYEDIRYGLGVETANFRTVAENYWRPLAAIWNMAARGPKPTASIA